MFEMSIQIRTNGLGDIAYITFIRSMYITHTTFALSCLSSNLETLDNAIPFINNILGQPIIL